MAKMTEGHGWRGWLAWKLRFLADRISPETAFRRGMFSFEFFKGIGAATNDENVGCPLWYYGPDYDKAFERYDLYWDDTNYCTKL